MTNKTYLELIVSEPFKEKLGIVCRKRSAVTKMWDISVVIIERRDGRERSFWRREEESERGIMGNGREDS